MLGESICRICFRRCCRDGGNLIREALEELVPRLVGAVGGHSVEVLGVPIEDGCPRGRLDRGGAARRHGRDDERRGVLVRRRLRRESQAMRWGACQCRMRGGLVRDPPSRSHPTSVTCEVRSISALRTPRDPMPHVGWPKKSFRSVCYGSVRVGAGGRERKTTE